MKRELRQFRVEPSVIPADKESEIKIRALDGRLMFFDDVTYEIQFIPTEDSDVDFDEKMTLFGYENNRKTFYVTPKNGVLTLKHFFAGEQEWIIKISTNDYDKHLNNELIDGWAPHWDFLRNVRKLGVTLSVYSVYEDLYKKRVLRGDLHVHTNFTDACDSPWRVASEYRRAGYDFIAISDHNLYDIGKYAREKFDFKTDFQILTAEEIHNGYNGQLHIVNIGGKKSLNEIYLNEPETVEKEIQLLKGEVNVPDGVNEKEYLHRFWVYKKVKETNGLVIFPHPHWLVRGLRWHCSPKRSEAIIKNGLCDAFEIISGNPSPQNNLQVSLYDNMRSQGIELPVVGSTDCHDVLNDTNPFNAASTFIFTENSNIKQAILDGFSVAAEHPGSEPTRFYGNYRLVRYARFLENNYFPIHTNLCSCSGLLIDDYVNGEFYLKETIELMEKRILSHEKSFFGK